MQQPWQRDGILAHGEGDCSRGCSLPFLALGECAQLFKETLGHALGTEIFATLQRMTEPRLSSPQSNSSPPWCCPFALGLILPCRGGQNGRIPLGSQSCPENSAKTNGCVLHPCSRRVVVGSSNRCPGWQQRFFPICWSEKAFGGFFQDAPGLWGGHLCLQPGMCWWLRAVGRAGLTPDSPAPPASSAQLFPISALIQGSSAPHPRA